ncbi:MAG: tRNA (guanosine(46)-N7)-methyltransferase TrmB, partial [Gammaproteobacteria bacterium]
VEIGFGDGEATWRMAEATPQNNFLAIEVHPPGVGRLLRRLKSREIGNVRVYCGDAVEFLEQSLPDHCVDEVRLYFPDPWPKKRHHKRRLVQPSFVSMVTSRLKPGGSFALATDWAGYAEHMLEVLEAEPALENVAGPGASMPRPSMRPRTKFERRGERLGNAVVDLEFRRVAAYTICPQTGCPQTGEPR